MQGVKYDEDHQNPLLLCATQCSAKTLVVLAKPIRDDDLELPKVPSRRRTCQATLPGCLEYSEARFDQTQHVRRILVESKRGHDLYRSLVRQGPLIEPVQHIYGLPKLCNADVSNLESAESSRYEYK